MGLGRGVTASLLEAVQLVEDDKRHDDDHWLVRPAIPQGREVEVSELAVMLDIDRSVSDRVGRVLRPPADLLIQILDGLLEGLCPLVYLVVDKSVEHALRADVRSSQATSRSYPRVHTRRSRSAALTRCSSNRTEVVAHSR